MRFDAQSPFVWRELNHQIREKLGCDSKVFLYRGMHQAIFEIVLGLNLRMGHKRKMVVETGLGDHLSQTELELAKLGVRFKSFFEEDVAKEEKNCLAYIHDLDDALTAELYDHIETLKKIAATKVYRIHLAHHLFHVRKAFVKNLSDFDIIIVSLDQNYALVFTGEKVVLPLLTVGQLPWSLETDGEAVFKLISEDVRVFQSEIVNFETSLPQGVKPWFTEQPARRIYDRSVIIFENHDGSAFRDLVLREMEAAGAGLGAHQAIETSSLCRWENESWFKQAEQIGRHVNDLRGMVAIDGGLVLKDFQRHFSLAFEKLNQLSQ